MAAQKYMIVEESYYTAQQVKRLVKELRPDYCLVGIYEEASRAVRHIAKIDTGFVITDVEAADGNSIEAYTRAHLSVPFIFLSYSNSFREKAEGLNLISFILHPVTYSALEEALALFELSLHALKKGKKQANEHSLITK